MLNHNGHMSMAEMMTPLLVRDDGLTPKKLTAKMTLMKKVLQTKIACLKKTYFK
jgi:hypothetical protein